MRTGGRRLFVGDERQAIYGFAGADMDSLQRIVQRTDATILPLSITYRCPLSHVTLARQLAPEIEAAPEATEGKVALIPEAALDRWLRPGALVLCRFTAPLVQHCLAQVRAGRPAVVRGMDTGKRLESMATQLFPHTLESWEGTRKITTSTGIPHSACLHFKPPPAGPGPPRSPPPKIKSASRPPGVAKRS